MVDLVIGLGSLRVDIRFFRSLCDCRVWRPLIPVVQFDDLSDERQGTSGLDYNVENYESRVREPTRRKRTTAIDSMGCPSSNIAGSRNQPHADASDATGPDRGFGQDRYYCAPGWYALV